MNDPLKIIPEAILRLKDGPEKKFKLIKFYGAALRERGIESKTMSCADIIAAVLRVAKEEGSDR
jgi:hypothetical protein